MDVQKRKEKGEIICDCLHEYDKHMIIQSFDEQTENIKNNINGLEKTIEEFKKQEKDVGDLIGAININKQVLYSIEGMKKRVSDTPDCK